jgi:hypothetical protein
MRPEKTPTAADRVAAQMILQELGKVAHLPDPLVFDRAAELMMEHRRAIVAASATVSEAVKEINDTTELRKLFSVNLEKLGRLCALHGLAGDEPLDVMLTTVRKRLGIPEPSTQSIDSEPQQ